MGKRKTKLKYYENLYITYSIFINQTEEYYTGRHTVYIGRKLPSPAYALMYCYNTLMEDLKGYLGSGNIIRERKKQYDTSEWIPRVLKVYSDLDKCKHDETLNIARYKSTYGKSCINISESGEGCITPKYTIWLKHRKTGKLVFVDNINKFCKKHEILSQVMLYLVKGQIPSYKDYILVNKTIINSKKPPKIEGKYLYNFLNKEKGIFERNITINSLSRKYGLNRGNLYNLKNGKIKTSCGWEYCGLISNPNYKL